MTCVSVVRLGPTLNNESASLLKSALRAHFQGDTGQLCDESTRINIQNRYFSAKVDVKDIGESSSHSANDDVPLKEDGVILVFNASRHQPQHFPIHSVAFDQLEVAHNQVENDGAGDLLRLCVGVYLGNDQKPDIDDKSYEKEYSERILWCLDRQYEYVEANLAEDAIKQGHDVREKEGFARIVEAIEGTVWSSSVMSSKKKYELKESYIRDQEIVEENGGESMQSVDVASNNEDGSRILTDVFHLREEKEEVTEDEKGLQKLEAVLRNAAQIREQSKSGSLMDDERRKRAGDAAMLLLDLMNDMGLEESDSENEIEGNNDQ